MSVAIVLGYSGIEEIILSRAAAVSSSYFVFKAATQFFRDKQSTTVKIFTIFPRVTYKEPFIGLGTQIKKRLHVFCEFYYIFQSPKIMST